MFTCETTQILHSFLKGKSWNGSLPTLDSKVCYTLFWMCQIHWVVQLISRAAYNMFFFLGRWGGAMFPSRGQWCVKHANVNLNIHSVSIRPWVTWPNVTVEFRVQVVSLHVVTPCCSDLEYVRVCFFFFLVVFDFIYPDSRNVSWGFFCLSVLNSYENDFLQGASMTTQ